MEKQTRWEKIQEFLLAPYFHFEYMMAKKWLDRNFGENNYWGDTIHSMLSKEYREGNIIPEIEVK